MKIVCLKLLLCFYIASFSQQVKQINILTAGELSNIIQTDEKKIIEVLTIEGNIDARDIKCIRDELVSLHTLDIENAKIVKYEGKNGTMPFSEEYIYQSDQLPPYSFYNYVAGKIILKQIELPVSISGIGHFAFKKCKGLIEITLPSNVDYIGESAFTDCVNLENVNFPESLKFVDSYAFCNCKELISITFNDSVELIGKSAFQDCSKLSVLNFGRSKISISDSAFAFCSTLSTLTCNSIQPPIVSSSAFDLTNIQSVYVPKGSFNYYKNNSIWGKFRITEFK